VVNSDSRIRIRAYPIRIRIHPYCLVLLHACVCIGTRRPEQSRPAPAPAPAPASAADEELQEGISLSFLVLRCVAVTARETERFGVNVCGSCMHPALAVCAVLLVRDTHRARLGSARRN
jgi:hypothetical protein